VIWRYYVNHPDRRHYPIRGMRLLTRTEVEAFIAAKPVAAIHFDAEWDTNYRTIVRRKMEEAEQALGEQVNFGEVDCDLAPDLAKSVPVLNVPSVAYYRKGVLIAALVGTEQDVRGGLERILRGEAIGGEGATIPDRGQRA
jgi:thioredoxin-like negative regulator of GroEL